ncbi:MAG TPA: GNAT family N-acetyltransferase [Caulobacteraceae bacterium]|nr:GNAT family N-acetyltransferase [Caulobacteraceae bacterium]
MTAPILTTARLRLAPHTLDDFADSAALWADERVTRFIGGRPSTSEEAWARLLRYVGHWSLLGFGYWAVREAASGRFVGEIGFSDFRREMDLPFRDVPEVGWALSPDAQGQGFATEAVQAALAWGAEHFGSPRAWCMIDAENAPSLRVAERCGFKPLGPAAYKGAEVLLFDR